MAKRVPRRSAFDVFCREAFRFLDGAGVPYLVIGGLAVVAVGEPRTTADVDVIDYASTDRATKLIREARVAGFEVNTEVEERRLSTTGTLRFRKGLFQLDIILASLPFEDDALAHAMRKDLFGCTVSLPAPDGRRPSS